jgi:acetyl/propionyl-CoA carboxylase alpha subunit
MGEEEARGRKARGAAGSSHPGKIMAPMPGKVTKVAVSQGAVVTRGEPLVVLEAMKMEYTLTADIDGRAAAVQCRAGDQVTLGQLLVRLEAGSGP